MDAASDKDNKFLRNNVTVEKKGLCFPWEGIADALFSYEAVVFAEGLSLVQ